MTTKSKKARAKSSGHLEEYLLEKLRFVLDAEMKQWNGLMSRTKLHAQIMEVRISLDDTDR